MVVTPGRVQYVIIFFRLFSFMGFVIESFALVFIAEGSRVMMITHQNALYVKYFLSVLKIANTYKFFYRI